MVALARTHDRLSVAFDPDSYRMTLGEHLEELRRRLIWALLGFGVALVVCLLVGKDRLVVFFCRPLIDAQQSFDLSTQLQEQTPGSVFMLYLKVCLITAAALSAPWSLYQLWRFVAAGLYEHERRHLTRYVPLSVTLLIAGMAFVYYAVLPWTLKFFIAFTMSIPAPELPAAKPPTSAPGVTAPAGPPTFIQVLDADPTQPEEGRWWLNRVQKRVKFRFGHETKTMHFNPGNLVGIQYTLPEYVDMALLMLISFGVSFQLPLVVLALERVGIVELDALRRGRKYVYFALVFAAAVITPGADVASLVALAVPLCLLYELGIWLAATRLPGGARRRAA
jgi:sec-independent protein translocase protein TatC